MNKLNKHWLYAFLTTIVIVLGAGTLLPWVRMWPESVHSYFNALNWWLRTCFTFTICVVFSFAMFKLFEPRARHLRHILKHPPAWLAALLAWIIVAVLDVCYGFKAKDYRASYLEWGAYGGGAFFVVGWWNGLWSELIREVRAWLMQLCRELRVRLKLESQTPERKSVKSAKPKSIQDISSTPWEEIEDWLKSDAPARYDFLGNQVVADRICSLISGDTRSVGIVGPFGAGKSSLVHWVIERLENQRAGGDQYFCCLHSCWGFETSASAIHDMLRSAVSKLNAELDTFQIDSLPESYRKTFSAAGDWLETVSNLVLRNTDPLEQFQRLSNLLGEISGRLVFIVEDLDRSDTANFEIQEVLAFLERLKDYDNLRFILTGGQSSTMKIDYNKLCDHIELLRTIQPQHSYNLINRVRERCLDTTKFPYIQLEAPDRNELWNPEYRVSYSGTPEISFTDAIALLLNTPRSLRHALGRTYSSWRTLHGEIDFNHLLAVNVLRFGAPECFQFLIRRWNVVHIGPEQDRVFLPSDLKGISERVVRIRKAICDDFTSTIESVEWNPSAARSLMEYIIPATDFWLADGRVSQPKELGRQFVAEERYWIRAVNEAIDIDDVRDQIVMNDFLSWKSAPAKESDLVLKLTSCPRYSSIFENFACLFFAKQRAEILLLCEHVIRRILDMHGASACKDSQGFEVTFRIASRVLDRRIDSRSWLKDRISEAASVSIEMVNGLWHYYGSNGPYSIVTEGTELVRQHLFDEVKANVKDDSALRSRLSSSTFATLYQLIFDPGYEGNKTLVDVHKWAWLGPIMLAALRDRNVLVASNCVVLLGARVNGRDRIAIDTEVLEQFFGENAIEVVAILEAMIDQLPEDVRSYVSNIVQGARKHLAGKSKAIDYKHDTNDE